VLYREGNLKRWKKVVTHIEKQNPKTHGGGETKGESINEYKDKRGR